MRGTGPSAALQRAGRAMASPSESDPVIRSTVVSGKTARGLRDARWPNLLDPLCIRPRLANFNHRASRLDNESPVRLPRATKVNVSTPTMTVISAND
jgi:hypothetical protein